MGHSLPNGLLLLLPSLLFESIRLILAAVPGSIISTSSSSSDIESVLKRKVSAVRLWTSDEQLSHLDGVCVNGLAEGEMGEKGAVPTDGGEEWS